jgi:hypothetical protein
MMRGEIARLSSGHGRRSRTYVVTAADRKTAASLGVPDQIVDAPLATTGVVSTVARDLSVCDGARSQYKRENKE